MNMILANWTYTKEEWRSFLRRPEQRLPLLHRMIGYLLAKTIRKAPVVSITPECISIGNDLQHFQGKTNQLRQIDLRDEGDINILSITYETNGREHEIKVPVPKGKLREAIILQEQLSNRNG